MRRASSASGPIRWLITVGLLFVVALLAAQDVETRSSLSEGVTVEAGDPCITTETVIRRLSSWLQSEAIDASIHVVVRPGTSSASFSFRRGDGAPSERHFDVVPQDCAARLDAITLAIALAIDPSVLSALPAEPATSGDVSTEDSADPAQSDVPEPETGGENVASLVDAPPEHPSEDASHADASGDEPPRRYALVLGGGAAFGVVPGISAVGSLSFEIMLGRILTLRAGGLVTARTQSEIGRGEVGLRIVAGRLDGCGGWNFGIARGDVCLGLGAGASIAQGRGFAQNLRTRGAWLAGLGRVSVTLPAGSRVGVRLVGDLIVPIIRPRVHVGDDAGNIGPVQIASPFSAVLSAEFLVRWP